ncbi:MAG: DUF2336 domain-containing protein [Pseudomonadota bacterium]
MSVESLDPYEISCLEVGIEHTQAENRIDAGLSIIKLLQATYLSPEERQILSNLLLKLTVDPVKFVRERMVEELRDLPGLAEDLVFSIIADDDELALPFLAQTRSLNAKMMTAIAKVGDAGRKLVIAARGDCALSAAEHLIQTGTPDIIAELLENFAVPLTAEHYELIISRHGTDKDISDRLGRRPDLPARHKVMMARAVSDELRSSLDSGDVAGTIRTQRAIDAAEEEAILKISATLAPVEQSNMMSYLCDLQQLTPSIVVRAACIGEMPFLESALSLLSGLSRSRVRNLMYGQGALSIRAVHARAKLPKVLFNPLRLAADAERERDAAGLPKSADHHGKQMVEAAITHYESFTPEQRREILQLLETYGSPKTRELASHLLGEEDIGIKSALAA